MNHLLRRKLKIPPHLWVLFFCLLGFGLRLQRLNFQPLWGDEGWSIYFAAQSLPQLLALTAIDIHPPLYYLLLQGWLGLAGFGAETARFFSVIAGTALIPTVAVLGRRLLGRRVGVAAAGIVAVMPMAVYYAQEVRMYGLVTLLGVLSTYFLLKSEAEIKTPGGRWSIAYVATATAALYTMYYAAFIVLFHLLYTLTRVVRQGLESPDYDKGESFKNVSPARFSGLSLDVAGCFNARRAWQGLGRFVWIGLLYLPWLVYAGLRTVNYVLNKREVEAYQPLNFLRFFGDHFVAFSIGHLSSDLLPYVWAVLPFVLLASAGFIITLYARQKPALSLYLYLFVPLLAGYLINLIFPFNPPYFERTWLVAAPAYWLFMAAGLVWLWDSQPVLAGALAVVMLLVTTVSLLSFYSLPRYSHEDYRPLLRDIAARAAAEDTLLASYQWQLGFYHAYLPAPQPRFFAVPGWGEGWAGESGRDQRRQDLGHIFETSPRLWFPAHQALGHFWEDEAEADIAALGYPALLQWYSPQTKLTLAGSTRAALIPAPAANFAGRLTLVEAKVGQEQYEAGRGIIPLILTWRKEKSLGSEHRVSLRLADAQGHTWSIRDSQPAGGQAFFTNLLAGDTLTDRHGLLVAAGTPPGRYRLLLSVRRISDDHPLDLWDAQGQPMGAELLLAEVEVIDPNPPVRPAALPVETLTDAVFGQEVRLVGYSLGQGPFKAGQNMPLNLFWESLAQAPGPLTTVIQLQDGAGQPVFAYEREPLRPTPQWQQGTLLHDPYDLPLPPTLPPGDYRLIVALTTPAQTRLAVNQSDYLILTIVTTIDRPHVFNASAPQFALDINFSDQAKLVGLDLPQTTVTAGDNLPLTLHWQALAPLDRNWTVFVHLLDDNEQIISQQDQIPGAGQFPTTSWLMGEYLLDSYNLLIPVGTPSGTYRLEVGLYDANDFSRLPVTRAGQVVGNRVVLDSWPIVVEESGK
ncbi:MAG: glycosyltransferase family 39 protein [Anaerolineae bacterium]|nr:glycosyltransferase family 39 protein [Anaerolineae bacterium]